MPMLSMSVALGAQQTVRQQMQQVAQQLGAMPLIQNPQLPALAGHIDTVKNHANVYLSAISAEMNTVCALIQQYGVQLNATTGQVLTIVNVNSDNAVIGQAQTLLKNVLNASGPLNAALNQLVSQVAAFNNDITADSRNLIVDQQQAQQIFAADQAHLQSLTAQLRALQQQLADKKRDEIIIGIFTFGIGAAIMELTGYVQSTENAINQANQQTNQLSQEMAQLMATLQALSAFSSGTAILSGLSQCLLKGWQTVNADLREVTQSMIPAAFLIATVNTINANWNEVVTAAAQLQA
ncbi:HBL/NHE enterotoxin family protein [Pseudomonas sp. NA-150]|uniref:HBL/NHE enterotoxin family protein n=1 Tax=Pseudomonas sp. NA-150 TaxID=3367525 RepID=UPI0037C7BCFE